LSLENEGLARLYFAKFPHDATLVDEALAHDFVFHHLREIEGLAAFREFMAGVSRAFPEFRFDLQHQISEGDLVAAHYDFSGTQHDTFLETIPSRGRAFTTRGMSLFRMDAGRIVEIWVAFNTLAMMRQLGASAGELGLEP
jgi:steroid delta-isomerase-like uncharacterized protein